MGPKLIGKDPTQLKVINRFMDYELKGHPYVKSPIDMACWDILGKVFIGLHYSRLFLDCFNNSKIILINFPYD